MVKVLRISLTGVCLSNNPTVRLNAAAACFAEKGYSACTIQDIIERANLSKGALYGHFRSKEELFKAMIGIEHGNGVERARALAKEPPYLDAIIRFQEACVRNPVFPMDHRRNPVFPMDHRLWIEVLAVAARDPVMKEAFAESERMARSVFKELLVKARDAGEIDPMLDVDATAIWLFSLGDGLMARIADDKSFDFQKHFDIFARLVRKALQA